MGFDPPLKRKGPPTTPVVPWERVNPDLAAARRRQEAEEASARAAAAEAEAARVAEVKRREKQRLADEAEAALLAAWGEPDAPPLRTAMTVLKDFAVANGTTVDAMLGPDRRFEVARLRQEAMLAVKEAFPSWSTIRIGQFFGGRDHSTVVHALRKARARVKPGRQAHQHQPSDVAQGDGSTGDLA